MHPFWIVLVFTPGILVALGLTVALQTDHAGIDGFGIDRSRLKIVIPCVAAFGPIVLTLLLLESALRRTDDLFMTWLRGGPAELPEAKLPPGVLAKLPGGDLLADLPLPPITNKAEAEKILVTAAQVGQAYLTLLDNIRAACSKVGIDASQLTASQALNALVACARDARKDA